MKLHEIHQNNEPLIALMLRKLLAKKNHVSIGVAKLGGELAHEGWITDIVWEEDTHDYEIKYVDQTLGGRQMYFTTASHLETFNLVKDDDEENVWHLQGEWERPQGWVGEAVEDDAPLVVTLTKQRLAKGESVFLQRTMGTINKQALFPIKSVLYDAEHKEITVIFTDSYRIVPHGLPARRGVKQSRAVLDNTHGVIDDRWTLSKGTHGWVLHVASTPLTDRLDGDETP